MISTVLANTGPWSEVVLAVVGLGFLILGAVLARRRERGRRAAGALAVLMTLVALAFALTPESGGAAPWFCSTGDGVPRFGDLANVALLFPAACLGVIATRAPLPVLAAASGLSAAIELVQGTFGALGRSCDLNDWYTNTAGAVVAVALGAAILHLVARGGATGGEVEATR